MRGGWVAWMGEREEGGRGEGDDEGEGEEMESWERRGGAKKP